MSFICFFRQRNVIWVGMENNPLKSRKQLDIWPWHFNPMPCPTGKYRIWNKFWCNTSMVVRTPGKPGIHLEFENSTWKTWNALVKSWKTPGIWDFPVKSLFCQNFDKISRLWRVTKHRPKVALLESPRKIHLEFHSSFGVLHLEILNFSPGKPGI